MRIRLALALFCGSAVAASVMLVACGNGDDNAVPAPKVSDASADGTVVVEGGAAHEGGASDAGAGDAAGDAGTIAALKHVYVIMMENHAQEQIIGDTTNAPNINMLATKYGLATKYFGVTHPSLPNYLAAISGDFQGIFDDCPAGPTVTCPPEEFIPNSGDGTSSQLMTPEQAANAAMIPHWFSGATLVDQLEEKHMTWASYFGYLPAAGDPTNGAPVIPTAEGGTEELNLYAQKHNPFMYFQSIRTNANRMQRILPYSNFATDIAGSTTPNYVWISPDQCADMHGINADTAAFVDAGFCTGTEAGSDMSAAVIQYGDAFVGGLVTKIMASPTWKEGSAIVVVFDEDDYAGTAGCCNSPTGQDGGTLGGALVPAIVISSLNPRASTSADPYNHYSLLATLQHIWGLACLVNTCGMTGTQLMTKLFLP
jgi:phosphatidylinositol-3-phosphatase